MTKQRPIPDPRKPAQVRDSVNGPIFVIVVCLVVIAIGAWLTWGCL